MLGSNRQWQKTVMLRLGRPQRIESNRLRRLCDRTRLTHPRCLNKHARIESHTFLSFQLSAFSIQFANDTCLYT
jgi:hypothetical protein